MSKTYLAIDIGASSGRGILAYVKDGKLVTEEIYRFSNHPLEKEGGLIWDVDHLFHEILQALRCCDIEDRRPDYVGIDTWGVDYVLLDEVGKRIDDCHCYRDVARHKVDDVHALIPFGELYERTGIQFQGFNTIYRLYADKLSGSLQRASTLLMLPDYLNYRLTGIAEQEYTNATTSGLVNSKTHDFDGVIIEKLRYPRHLFKNLSQPGTIVGELKGEVVELVGYHAKVVHVASHDTASAVLAIPLEKGEPYISSGTWSLLGVEVPNAITTPKARELNYSNEGSLNHTFRFQKNIMGLWMIQEIRNELDPKPEFAEMVKLARKNPSDKRVDVNSPRYLSPKSMIGALKEEVGDVPLGELIYIVYASLADCYAASLREIESLVGYPSQRLRITGGGGKNMFLNQLTAKAIHKPVSVGPIEGTAIGNLLMQMLASNEITSLEEGRALIKNSITIQEVLP